MTINLMKYFLKEVYDILQLSFYLNVFNDILLKQDYANSILCILKAFYQHCCNFRKQIFERHYSVFILNLEVRFLLKQHDSKFLVYQIQKKKTTYKKNF